MLHVSLTYPEKETLRILLEGGLDTEHAAALQSVIDRAAAGGIGSLIVSCKGLQSADETGIRLLRAVLRGGGRIENLSWYLRWKLSHDPLSPTTHP